MCISVLLYILAFIGFAVLLMWALGAVGFADFVLYFRQHDAERFAIIKTAMEQARNLGKAGK